MPLSRRRFVIASAAAAGLAGRAMAAADPGFAAIEARVAGRLGVAAVDLASGAGLAQRADERFPMCSTFKAMAAAAVLKRVDAGAERLDRFVRYSERDLLAYAPTTRAHLKDGGMTLGDLCQAAVELSDNGAANLILASLGGPHGWTRYVRTLGDTVSRLDRREPALNTSVPGEARDTTTPAAMLADLRKTVLGDALSPASRQRLQDWLIGCKTGDARLRAGLPTAWRVGDKTGTWSGVNAYASSNDIAVAWTPTQPILISCYITGADSVPGAVRDSAIADVARLVAATFRPDAAHG
ncbi:MAG TPA: class A beta-lactamase [Caulobacteraceae bacterium]|jgi:beta-lactamase class A